MFTRILLLDDDRWLSAGLTAAIEAAGHSVVRATTAAEAMDELEGQRIELLLGDLPLLAPGLLPELRARKSPVLAIVLTGCPAAAQAVAAMRAGAFDYLLKPASPAHLRATIERAIQHRTLVAADPPSAPATPRPAPAVAAASAGIAAADAPMPLALALEGSEREILRRSLLRHHFNRQATAAELGINRTTLYKKMRKYALDVGEPNFTDEREG